MSDKTARIRELNDEFRKTFEGGSVVITIGVNALEPSVKKQVIDQVRAFDKFTNDNDPHGEHDFGSFDVAGDKIFWKIDYYDVAMNGGSEDPSDPDQTTRALTIMLATEY
jgi:hypothetical protein